jgi:S-adenosylhomocysteine hydrolase
MSTNNQIIQAIAASGTGGFVINGEKAEEYSITKPPVPAAMLDKSTAFVLLSYQV